MTQYFSFTKTNNFDSISSELSDDTLIICDIDETLLKQKDIDNKWYERRFNEYFKLTNDYNYSLNKAINDWTEHITTNDPEHTDKTGFFKLLEEMKKYKNTDLIFLTARSETLKDVTKNHLNLLEVPEHYNVHYSGEIPKGQYFKENIICHNFKKIIFIDDFTYNLESMFEELKKIENIIFKLFLFDSV